jgi:polyhydroxyalkanoate synthase subunit PhaC
MIARMTSGVSPLALTQAHADWAQHLLLSPDEQIEFVHKAARKWARFVPYSIDQPLPQDKRFAGQAWQHWPFNAFYQNFLLTQQWWHNATTGVPGVSRHYEDIVSFLARQALDIVSPANFPFTNPEVIKKTAHQGGMNFVRGALNFWEDWQRIGGGDGPVGSEAFKVGRDVAVTPGKVIFRNRLIELIQYAPTTVEVYAEPILIVPAWITKYYILDLSLENSLAALDVVSATVPERQVHAVGYCLGGTLLAIATAAMARDEDERLKSVTLFAAQSDFTEAGETHAVH